MATNTLLTPTMITRKALMVLHQKCNFISNVNRQYDDRFAQDGAKIGDSINIRMPAKYTVRSGATLAAQEDYHRSTPLQVSSQVGVDLSFTTAELTMDIDDFSERVIDPAMAQLAAHIENACLQAAYKTVNNYTNGLTDATLTYKNFAQGGANMTQNLAPTSNRAAILNPSSAVEFNDAVKGLFHSSTQISKAYAEGLMGRTSGFDVYENTLTPSHTTGTFAGTTLTDGSDQGISATSNVWSSQSIIQIDGATSNTTLLAGDIITFATCFSVHPESKVSTGKLQRFVVQANATLTTTATGAAVTVKPAMIHGSGNAYRNCTITGGDTDGLTVALIGAVGTAYNNDLQFHKDAFVFATADLIDVSKYGAWGARQSMDGISMRIAKQYAIGSDTVPCRLDVLYGFAPLYPELANRIITPMSLL